MRWSARYRVPFKRNPYLQGDHSLTLRGALVAQDLNLEDQYNQAVFSAFWTDAVNITDRSALIRHLEGAGLDGSSILKRADEPDYGKRLSRTLRLLLNAEFSAHPPFSLATISSLETIAWISSRRLKETPSQR